MVSQTVINAMGIIGGVVLAVCQAPQLIKLYRTKSAADLSYFYLALYALGLFFITVYLFLEKATVGWICETIEFACSVMLIVCKFYLDNWRPLSPRGKRRADGSPAHGAATVGELGVAALVGSGASQLVLLPHGDSSTATEELRNGSGLEGGSGGGGSRGRQLESAAAAAAGEGGRALPGMLTGHRRGRRRSHEPMGAV